MLGTVRGQTTELADNNDYVKSQSGIPDYLVPQFGDGQREYAVTGGGIAHDQVVIGDAVQDAEGNLVYPTRPAGEVVGWVV